MVTVGVAGVPKPLCVRFRVLQRLAVQRSKFHPNESMGAKKGVDAANISNNEVEEDEWDDDD